MELEYHESIVDLAFDELAIVEKFILSSLDDTSLLSIVHFISDELELQLSYHKVEMGSSGLSGSTGSIGSVGSVGSVGGSVGSNGSLVSNTYGLL